MSEDHRSPPEVYDLPGAWTIDDLEAETPYLATVNGVVPYGVFVDVTDRVSGLVHESTLRGTYAVGDELVVSLLGVEDNGDVAFEEIDLPSYDIVRVRDTPEMVTAADATPADGPVAVAGRVAQVKQTGGPTVFHVMDGTGVLPCAAFSSSGRAHPAIDRGDLVRAVGDITEHGEGLQLEVDSLAPLAGEEATELATRIEDRVADRAAPDPVEPLIEWAPLTALRPELERLATQLRRAVLEHRPVRLRHHADGDGICAAVPVAVALERFVASVHRDPGVRRYLISRAPSRAPFYEMEDSTRDLNRALQDRSRHGQRFPFLLMLDNGSTAEDVPGYRNLAHYDLPIAVVDHHHPEPEAVADLLTAHVNPYLVGEDYRVTTGMLCAELARMIDPAITPEIAHVPAVAGIADRSEAAAMTGYLSLAAEAGYDREDVTRIGDALDYASHWLRYQPGERVIRDVLGVDADAERHRRLIGLLSDEARSATADQLAAALPHVRTERLPTGAHLHRLDLDAHAHRFRYPAPGRTTGAVHDRLAGAEEAPAITIGYGPDFCVLRSDGVRLDIPGMVADLRDQLPGAGIEGGGHLVVGAIKFVQGRRAEVLEALVARMGEAALDEELTSTAAVPEDS